MTVKVTVVSSATGLPKTPVTEAVTVWVVPAALVAVAGSKVMFAGGPDQNLVA